MTTAVYNALAALQSQMEESYDPAPQAALNGVWLYPYEYEEINLTELPVAVISRVVGGLQAAGLKATGVNRHDWQIEVLVFLAGGGGMEFPSLRAAQIEVVQEEYIIAMWQALWPDITLGGVVDMLGSDAAGYYKLFDYMLWHWTWDGRTYWGVRFVIPAAQFVNQVMGPQ